MDIGAAWAQMEAIRQQRRQQAGIVADARQPVAYEVVSERGREAVYAADLREHAERACTANGWRLVPIYGTR